MMRIRNNIVYNCPIFQCCGYVDLIPGWIRHFFNPGKFGAREEMYEKNCPKKRQKYNMQLFKFNNNLEEFEFISFVDPELGVEVKDVVDSGPGLAFVRYFKKLCLTRALDSPSLVITLY
jgi:hypothetical protein